MSKEIMLAIIGFLLITLLGVGFLVFNYTETIREQNQIEQQRILLENTLERDRIQQEQAREDQKEMERGLNLSNCLDVAFQNYTLRWNSSCEDKATTSEDLYNKCILNCIDGYFCGFNTTPANYCRSQFPIISETECSLDSDLATRWDNLRTTDEQRCYEQFGR